MDPANTIISERIPSTVVSSTGGLSHHKRKRTDSPTSEAHPLPVPPPKAPKTQTNHLQINYLVRYYSEDLQLVTVNDSLPTILALVNDYDGVLQRHESMAGNLGAKPLGPILIKRFDRIFDGAPKVLKNNGKEGTAVSWLDVVEFARNKPEQFKLEATRDGVRVCHFYTKQCRVEITEEDYVLVASGMPQKLIPPQPIMEDEEKELGTLEILEVNLGKIVQLADQVSARARQLNHRLKNRKSAITSRRAAEAAASETSHVRSMSPSTSTQRAPPGVNGGTHNPRPLEGGNEMSSVSQSGFVAVNSRPEPTNGLTHDPHSHPSSQINGFQPESTDRGHELPLNGRPGKNGSVTATLREASPTTHKDLLNKFFTTATRPTRPSPSSTQASTPAPPATSTTTSPPPATKSALSDATADYAAVLLRTAAGNSAVAIPQTPSSLVAQASPSPAHITEKDDGGPYKAEMVGRMEKLERGERVLPPCDRCRRLHMDCVKNLTACAGCTKKHAKCAWREIRGGELAATAGSASGDDHEYRPTIERGSGDGFRESRRSSDDHGSKTSEETRDINMWSNAEVEQKRENASNARSDALGSAYITTGPAARQED
ncbi:MAG: hypothetical protein M1812_007528 [Candelaria pacifica]|nr:MAG: hypothetical protein M1812_007528 [Candelaria pacifica]